MSVDASFEQLGDFLRACRARVGPEEVGLPVFGRKRRVAGLRREEVAQLAGVSVDYYVRLEQGRGQHVSDAVLDAIGRALRLDPTEYEHMWDLARPTRVSARQLAPSTARPGVQVLLDRIDAPAFVLGRCMDVLTWNPAADAVMGLSAMAPHERNMARHTFLSPDADRFYPDWERVAADTVAFLRLDAARHSHDARMAALVEELSAGNPCFRPLWDAHQVAEKTHGTKRLRPADGTVLDTAYETLSFPGDPDLMLVVYTTAPRTARVGAEPSVTAARP
ncbi:helix-turn-helix transcriptional regulator [Embleya scabrispora]|uniref:helix-turn-helix transcriptional regulator n=1 Tax=Embleya scabrispora TaxID=159449 RepID=UPI00037205DA|nr:helix-turn-helix transcriptional regulator [Embleya scabrispora]MYS80985.1 helix-turn-helix domain-containing protein [Streptomyces sp. SID5474]